MLTPNSPMTTCSTTNEVEDGPATAVGVPRGKAHRRTGRKAPRGKPTRKSNFEGPAYRGRYDARPVGPRHVRSKQSQAATSPPWKGCNAAREWVLAELLTGHRVCVVPSKASGETVTGTVVARLDDEGGRGGRHEMVLESGACRFFDLTQVDDWALVDG